MVARRDRQHVTVGRDQRAARRRLRLWLPVPAPRHLPRIRRRVSFGPPRALCQQAYRRHASSQEIARSQDVCTRHLRRGRHDGGHLLADRGLRRARLSVSRWHLERSKSVVVAHRTRVKSHLMARGQDIAGDVLTMLEAKGALGNVARSLLVLATCLSCPLLLNTARAAFASFSLGCCSRQPSGGGAPSVLRLRLVRADEIPR